ncbi:unnamed protein product [Rhizophagus irregularis]|nr:unnamed protein product [Rhizophagus irregularis]
MSEIEKNVETKVSIEYEQQTREAIIIESEDKTNGGTIDAIKNYKIVRSIKSRKYSSKSMLSHDDDIIIKKEDFQIAISQSGRFVATFDTANFRIKILENTDRRPLSIPKVEDMDSNKSNIIGKTIVHFKIRDDFNIDKFYTEGFTPPLYKESREQKNVDITVDFSNDNDSYNDFEKDELIEEEKFRWSFDISNVCMNNNKHFIFVAVSRIDDEDLRGTTKETEKRGTTIIYPIELLENENENYTFVYNPKASHYQTRGISGICRFVESSNDNESSDPRIFVTDNKCFVLKKFVVLNFHGIHNFNCTDGFQLSRKFNYPNCIRRELDSLDSSEISDCMDILLSCVYDKYFLVEQYKNNVQLLEVYGLAKMKLETITKRVENSQDKLTRKYNRNIFSVSKNKLYLCFTRGIQSVKLYFLENGLESISKKFDDIEKIYSLEFIENDRKLLVIGSGAEDEENLKIIIWDMYNVGETEMIELDDFLTTKNISTRLARTSGNLLQIDDKGNITSILKRVDKLLEQKQLEEVEKSFPLPQPPDLSFFNGEKLDGGLDKRHTIYYDKITNPYFKPIVVEKEPWVLGDYDRQSYCLYQNKNGSVIETIQLIIGRSTVQIWHQINSDDKNIDKDELPNRGEPFLEYIWTNGIPVIQENPRRKLRIEMFEYGPNDGKMRDFYLKVYWYEKVSNEFESDVDEITKQENEENKMIAEDENKMIAEDENKMVAEDEKINEKKWNEERKERIIRRYEVLDKANAVKCACKALEYINRRTKFLVNYVKEHRCEEMVAYINRIIWRFIKYRPDDFKLLDVRHNVMKNLILGDCDHLIKFILFGNDDDDKKANKLHIPRNTFWKKRKYVDDDTESEEITNVMELAIYHCKGREIKDTIIVAYLLEYYSMHATDYAGWMSTVSKALPLLFKYHYDDYVKKLFRKECFANQNYLQDPYNIIPEEYLELRNLGAQFRAFEFNLKSDKCRWYDVTFKMLDYFRIKMFKFLGDLDNKDVEKQTLALRVVPLPEFTRNCIPQQNKSKKKIFLNVLLFLFVPRWYRIGRNEKNKLSPFSRVVQYENIDDIYDNPATEAIIDFRWQRARTFFFILFLRFLLYILCFGLVSWAYLDHSTVINVDFLIALIVVFYYLAVYLSATEIIQLIFHGPRKYFESIYNIFDIFSIILPVIVMSIMIGDFRYSDGFGGVENTDTGLIALIAFAVFFLWIEGISYLRLIPNIAIYIYYVMIITKTVLPFILFNVIVILAFAHTMFILLTESKNIKTKDSTYSGTATNPLNGQEFNVEMKADFDPTDRNDNPFSYFPMAMVATYFWLNGDFVQRDSFDFWAVEVFSLIASVLLVTILQNMLIAFMGGVYEEAATKGRQALLRFRANQIANYEALYHIHFPPIERDPKYIYYIGQSKNFEKWCEDRKDDGAIYKGFEEKSTFTKFVFEEKDYDKFSIWVYDDDDDIEIEINNIKKMKKDLNDNIDNLLNKLNDQKRDDNAEKIDKKIKEIENINNINGTIELLIKKLNNL